MPYRYRTVRTDGYSDRELDQVLNAWAERGWDCFQYSAQTNTMGNVVCYMITFKIPFDSVELSAQPAQAGFVSPPQQVHETVGGLRMYQPDAWELQRPGIFKRWFVKDR